MSNTSIYLNFSNQTEEAFNFYKSVFATDFVGGITRLGDVPPQAGQPELDEVTKKLIMHVQLPLLGGVMLHGTDAPESMNFKVIQGNNFYIMLEPDTKAEADELFAKLSVDGKIEMKMSDMFWGDYWGSFTDKFGINWMINVVAKK